MQLRARGIPALELNRRRRAGRNKAHKCRSKLPLQGEKRNELGTHIPVPEPVGRELLLDHQGLGEGFFRDRSSGFLSPRGLSDFFMYGIQSLAVLYRRDACITVTGSVDSIGDQC